MVVTFCGHRDLTTDEEEKLKELLYNKLEKLIKNGADEFLLGGYGDFDKICAETVKKLKIIYPHIKSILVIPYLDREYNLKMYDSTMYPPIENVPKKFAIPKRNEYMVDNADFVISYVISSWGGALTTLNYAKRKKKETVNLAEIMNK